MECPSVVNQKWYMNVTIIIFDNIKQIRLTTFSNNGWMSSKRGRYMHFRSLVVLTHNGAVRFRLIIIIIIIINSVPRVLS